MKKNIYAYLIITLTIILLGIASYSCSKTTDGEDTPDVDVPTDILRFNGSFIQQWFVADWDDARWDKEMIMLKEAGIEYLVYGPAHYTNANDEASTSYPSSLVGSGSQADIIDKCLKSAQKNGVKIFLGLNFNERWWNADYGEEWLTAQMEIGNRVADELVALYKSKYSDAMYGWYWVWEVDNLNWTTLERQDFLAKALNTNLDHLSQITPQMPFMLSPFMNEKLGTASQYRSMWQYVFARTHFRNGDIFSPQDCVGAGGLSINSVANWFSELGTAVKTKSGLKFWGNVETFDQKYWISSPLTQVQKQMEIVNDYVSNIICFAYSHYYSPYVVDKNYHKTYLEYCKTGKLEATAPARVQSVRVEQTTEGVNVVWTNPTDMNTVSGYSIYKNGTLLNKVQVKLAWTPSALLDAGADLGNVYEVATYNVLGVESEKVKARK